MKYAMNLILSVLMLTSGLASAGPLIVRNGGGSGEFYLIYALQNYDLLLDLCLNQNQCAAGVSESLQTLRKTADASPLQFEFVDSRILNNDLYRSVGLKIQINKDLLYSEVNGELQPWKYVEAVVFVTARMAERSVLSNDEARQVATRLAEFSEVQVRRTPISDIELRQFSLVQLESPFTSLIIEDASLSIAAQTLEIPLASTIDCQSSVGITGKVQNLEILSSRWLFTDRNIKPNPVLNIAGIIKYQCLDTQGRKQPFRSEYRISIDTTARDNQRTRSLVPNSVVITQEGIQSL